MAKPICIIASNDNFYVRRVLERIYEGGQTVEKILIGSRVERISFKISSLRRIRAQLGWVEVFRRIVAGRRSSGAVQQSAQSLRDMAEEREIEIIEYDRVNHGLVAVELLKIPDCLAVLAGTGIIGEAIILAARGGCINGHPAILPGIRGVDVIEWSVLEDQPFGVTAHLVEANVDSGEILMVREVQPEVGAPFSAFQEFMISEQADVLAQATLEYCAGKITPCKNDLDRSILRFAVSAAQRDQAKALFDKKYKKESSPTG